MKGLIAISADLQLQASADTGGGRRFFIEAYNGGPLLVHGFDLPVYVDLATLIVPPTGATIVLDHQLRTEKTVGQTDTIENTGFSLSLGGPVTGECWPDVEKVIEQHDKGYRWQASIGCVIYETETLNVNQTAAINGQIAKGPCYIAYAAQLRETSIVPNGADSSTSVNLAASAAYFEGAIMPTFEEWLAKQVPDVNAVTPDQMEAFRTQYAALQKGGNSDLQADEGGTTTATSGGAVLDFTTWLMALGFALKDLSDQQKAAMSVKYQAETGQPAVMPGTDGASTDGTPLQASIALHRKAAADEFTRQTEIQRRCSGFPKIIEAGIRLGWSPDTAELQMRREKEKQVPNRGPAGHVVRPRSNSARVIEAALYMAAGFKKHEKHFKTEELEAADAGYRGYGLQQLILEAACANGYDARPGEGIGIHNYGTVMKYASGDGIPPHMLQASVNPSYVNTAGILSNLANKAVEDGFNEEDQSWREIAKIRPAKDFKEQTIYRMLDDFEYQEIKPGGEFTYGSLGESSYTVKPKTYGRMVHIGREETINDDLGVFDTVRVRLGGGGAKKLNRVVWTAVLAAPFFTAGNGNWLTGDPDSVLSLSSSAALEKAITAFTTMRSPKADGNKYIGGTPKILLVPPALQFVAQRYYVQTNLGAGTTVADANIHAGQYKPVVSPFLSDTSIPGNSATAWYLLGDPNTRPLVVVTFLSGVEMPTVETEAALFNRFGMELRGYHDFGAQAAEQYCGIKSKGAAGS